MRRRGEGGRGAELKVIECRNLLPFQSSFFIGGTTPAHPPAVPRSIVLALQRRASRARGDRAAAIRPSPDLVT